MFLAPGNNLSL